MSGFERTRVREHEAGAVEANSYELIIQQRLEFADRQISGPVVIKLSDRRWQVTRQGKLVYYLAPLTYKDTPLQDWLVFRLHIHTHSGKHRHQGGLVIYVIEGEGHSIVDGERIEWKAGDLMLLPIRPGGVEHQHYNAKPGASVHWIAFCYMPIMDHLAMEMQQMENSPDFKP